MKTKLTPNVASTLLLLSTVTTFYVAQLQTAYAQGTAFTYQGRLGSGGNPANGFFDITFSVWTNASGPAQVGATVTTNAVAVSNGLFTVALDFGNQFPGADRWLEIGVRTNGGGAFTTLAPRQKLTPTPYAITSSSLSGTLANSALPTGGNWPLSTTLTLDTSTFAIDPVNKRVGIGTSTPATPLTLATGIGYGIEHTDGTHRLSTFLDANGCWFGSVSPDKLFFYVNNGLPSMTIDLAGRVGIGTTTPAYLLHIAGGLGAARLESTSDPNGSVLELRNTMASPSYLGAINFNNAAGTFPGQIGYYANHVLAFRTAGAQRMELSDNGQLSVFGSSTRGVYAEATAGSGIGMFGFNGPSGTASSGNGNTGVYGESASSSGNGVVGAANVGTAAYGVWGRSTSGYGGRFDGTLYGIYASASGTAGYFNNLTVIEADSSIAKPHLRLRETQDGDFARLEFQAANRPYWHIAVGGGAANQMNFYNSTNGDVMSLTQDGTLFTKVLTITGGADIAEPFKMSQANLPKGAVVVIDEDKPGHLKLSAEPYDRRVAGVLSGAGGVKPGLSLSQQGVMDGGQHVALTGRVYVQADISNGPIKPGDLLTTSGQPGYAMKVTDYQRAQGAILGKAMTGLIEGKGLVLVLVTLQ